MLLSGAEFSEVVEFGIGALRIESNVIGGEPDRQSGLVVPVDPFYMCAAIADFRSSSVFIFKSSRIFL